jgi:hypothetical protein
MVSSDGLLFLAFFVLVCLILDSLAFRLETVDAFFFALLDLVVLPLLFLE